MYVEEQKQKDFRLKNNKLIISARKAFMRSVPHHIAFSKISCRLLRFRVVDSFLLDISLYLRGRGGGKKTNGALEFLGS